MGRLWAVYAGGVQPGGCSRRNCRWGCDLPFLNGEAILDENMLFWVHLYALVVVLKILLDFRL